MDDRTAIEGALVPRRIQPLVRTRPDSIRRRFNEDNERFKIAVQRFKSSVRETVREMTPAAKIQARPMAWVAGGLATGLLLGMLLSRRRHPYW